MRETTSIAENVMYLRYNSVQGEAHRLLSILKIRDSAYDTTVRTFTIGAQGIVVGEALRRAAGFMLAFKDTPAP